MLTAFAGVRIIVGPDALVKTDERTFPVSRHRSARVHKKLLKRFGSEYVMQPGAFHDIARNIYIVHPEIAAVLRAQTRQVMDAEFERVMRGF